MEHDNPIVDLKNLKQTRSVQSYQDLFEGFLNKVDFPQSYTVILFLGGLKDEIFMPIRMFKLTNLADAYCMARMQESTNAPMKPRYNPKSLFTKPESFGYGNNDNGILTKPVNNTLALPTPRQAYTNNMTNRK